MVLRQRARLQALADRLDEMPGTPASIGVSDRQGEFATSSPDVALRFQPTRLPVYLTRLIGAEAAQARLRALIGAYRLVTVLGAGGVGKTRLAVEVAQQLSPGRSAEPRLGPAAQGAPARFERALFVSLVDCSTDAQLLDRLKLALRLESAGDAAAQLVDTLDAQALLLVLDNCEQLDDAATARISWLAERLPQAHWLATSRRPLGLDGERECLLAPLRLPASLDTLASVAANPSVALFVDRARLLRAEFQAHAENHESLVALVRWLDGLPLAIELAASRSRTMDAAQMLALLQTARTNAAAPAAALTWLSPRGTRSGSDPRHASMLAVIEWS